MPTDPMGGTDCSDMAPGKVGSRVRELEGTDDRKLIDAAIPHLLFVTTPIAIIVMLETVMILSNVTRLFDPARASSVFRVEDGMAILYAVAVLFLCVSALWWIRKATRILSGLGSSEPSPPSA